MILTVNIGNTHITVGGYEQDTLIFCGRLHSDPAATVEEYAIRLVNLLQLYGASPAQIEGGILGSVVPMLSGRVLAALQLLCKARILTVGPGLKSGIKLRLDNPAQLGAELLCGAVAALAEGPGPLVVISADTAISLMAVNAKQELVGGVILPGPQLSHGCAGAEHRPAAPDRPLRCLRPGLRTGQEHRRLLAERLCAGHRRAAGRPGRPFLRRAWPCRPKFYATGNLPTRHPGRLPHALSSTARRSSRTACTASGCGIGRAEVFICILQEAVLYYIVLIHQYKSCDRSSAG